MKTRLLLVFTLTAVLLLFQFLFVPQSATATVRELSFAQLTARANVIASGTVTGMQSEWTPDHAQIFTNVTIRTDQVQKGTVEGQTLTLQVPGGEAEGIIQEVSDTPDFSVGEQVIIFARGNPPQLVGWFQGKFSVIGERVMGTNETVTTFMDKVGLVLGALARGERAEGIQIEPDRSEPESTAAGPVISSISPNRGSAKAVNMEGGCAADSTKVTINGSSFGTGTNGIDGVFFYGKSSYKRACVVSWSNTKIVVRVPSGASSGHLLVETKVGSTYYDSNHAGFTVTYSYGGGRWQGSDNPTIKYYVNANTGDVSNELDGIKASAKTWTDVSGASFNFSYAGTSTATTAKMDGKNTLSWVNTDTGSVGTTTTWYNTADKTKILEFDTVFNDKTISWDNAGAAGKFDIQSVTTHELGHTLKLLDLYGSADAAKTMRGSGSTGGGISMRSLEADDIAGIRYIYLGPPGNVAASDKTYADRVRVTWSAAPESAGYMVYRNTSNTTLGAVLLKTLTGTFYDDMTATKGKTYYYWVRAYNAVSTSGFSTSNAGSR